MGVTRRAVLAAAPAATVSTISPALGRVYRSVKPGEIDAELNELACQFVADAKAIDPSITGGWVCKSLMLKGRDPGGAVVAIHLDRDEDPFFKSKPKAGA